MKEYFLGIDNGGTLTKAVLFDGRGNEIAGASRKVPMIMPQPGFTERDMDVLWGANCEVIREVVDRAGVRAEEIQGVACTGHGKGLYLWGRDEKPAYNGIVSTDTRAWEYPEIDGRGMEQRHGFSRRPFRRSLPVNRCPCCDGSRTIGPAFSSASAGYSRSRTMSGSGLTGEAFAEVTDYSGSSLMNIRDVRFDATCWMLSASAT